MSSQTVRIGRRFNGPDGWANGGMACGMVGSVIPGPSTVRLMSPVPLDKQLRLDVEKSGQAVLFDGECTLALASPLGRALPRVEVSGFEALERLPELDLRMNPFRRCFVCGDLRGDGFGLRPRISPDGRMAAVWDTTRTPAPLGPIPTQFVWAALDCPSGFAALIDVGPGVLGTQSVEIARRPTVGERLTVIAEPHAHAGSKHVSCASIYDDDGALVATSEAIWLAVDVGSSLNLFASTRS